MHKRFITIDVQVAMVMFVVVIGQQAPKLVMDIVVVALVETAVLRWQLWSSLPEGSDGGVGVKVVLLPSLAEEGIERWWSAQGLACRKEGSVV